MVPFGALYADASLHVRYANRQLSELFGTPPKTEAKPHLSVLLGEKNYRLIEEALIASVSRRETSISLETSQGERKTWLEVSLWPDLGARGELFGLFLVVQDTTPAHLASLTSGERLTRSEILRHMVTLDDWISAEPEACIQRAVEMIAGYFPHLSVTLSNLDETDTLHILYSSGSDGLRLPEGQILELDRWSIQLARIRTGSRLALEDLGSEFEVEGPIDLPPELRSLATANVSVADDHVEILSFSSNRPHRWSYYELESLRALAESLSDSLKCIRRLRPDAGDESWRQRLSAEKDHLTGLPNWYAFLAHLSQVLAQANRNKSYFALLRIDLGDFNALSGRLGWNRGSLIIKESATRIRQSLRKSDMVARAGMSGFAALITDLSRPDDSGFAIEKIMKALQRPVELEREQVTLSPVVGISSYPFDGLDSESLIKGAESALSLAKESRKDRYRHCSRAIEEKVTERLQARRELKHALEDNEFILHYQPIIDLRKQSVSGVEALLRWNKEGRELRLPREFLPTLEETGLMSELTIWVLRQACKQYRRWEKDDNLTWRVSVNVGNHLLGQLDVTEKVPRILSEMGVPPSALMLESTELALMELGDLTVSSLEELTASGVSMIIDDFGSGYSSVVQLAQIPLYALKVPQEVVGSLSKPGDSGIKALEAVAAVAGSLGSKVIAEAVESQEQLQIIKKYCDEFQGNLFCGPTPGHLLPSLIKNQLETVQLTLN